MVLKSSQMGSESDVDAECEGLGDILALPNDIGARRDVPGGEGGGEEGWGGRGRDDWDD